MLHENIHAPPSEWDKQLFLDINILIIGIETHILLF